MKTFILYFLPLYDCYLNNFYYTKKNNFIALKSSLNNNNKSSNKKLYDDFTSKFTIPHLYRQCHTSMTSFIFADYNICSDYNIHLLNISHLN